MSKLRALADIFVCVFPGSLCVLIAVENQNSSISRVEKSRLFADFLQSSRVCLQLQASLDFIDLLTHNPIQYVCGTIFFQLLTKKQKDLMNP